MTRKGALNSKLNKLAHIQLIELIQLGRSRSVEQIGYDIQLAQLFKNLEEPKEAFK